LYKNLKSHLCLIDSKFLCLQEIIDKSLTKPGSRKDETNFEQIAGPSNQQGSTTFETKIEKPNSLQHANNYLSDELSFNNLNNSMFNNLKVSVHSLDNCNSCSNHEHFKPQAKPIMTDHVDVLEIARRKAEINAAITSLKTNLVLGVCILLVFTCFFLTPISINSILVTLLKGLIPIVTTISNFVKIQEIVELYWIKYNPFSFKM